MLGPWALNPVDRCLTNWGMGEGLGDPMIQPRTPNAQSLSPEQFPDNPMSLPFAALYTFLNLAKDEENIVNIKFNCWLCLL